MERLDLRSNSCLLSDPHQRRSPRTHRQLLRHRRRRRLRSGRLRLTLTGTNDAPKLTGFQSSLPGGSEDNDYTITKNQLLAGFSDADAVKSLTLDIINLVATDDDGNCWHLCSLNASHWYRLDLHANEPTSTAPSTSPTR